LLSKEKLPAVLVRAKATPLFAIEPFFQPRTSSVMSIRRKLLRLAVDMKTGFPPVAEDPNGGAGELKLSVFSAQALSTSCTSKLPLAETASTNSRNEALFTLALAGRAARLNRM
jgi:hypothetical protein